MDFREVAVAIANDKVISYSIGQAGGVDFEWEDIKSEWDSEPFSMLYLMHTHPSGFRFPSSTDDNMLCGWAKAFNVPVVCVIVTDNGARAYLYMQYNHEIVRLALGSVEKDYLIESMIKASYSGDDRYMWEIEIAKDLKSRVKLRIEMLYIWRLNVN